MQVPKIPESDLSKAPFGQASASARQCNGLAKIARTVGAAAGYLQRSRTDMLGDAEMLHNRSPERSVVAAAAIGLLLGTVLRNRR